MEAIVQVINATSPYVRIWGGGKTNRHFLMLCPQIVI